MTDILGKPRRVVCAACRYPDGTTLVGPRHFDKTMCDQFHKMFQVGKAPNAEAESVQGFLDQYGVFMDRKEALAVALEAGQIDLSKKSPPEDRLFSEDLY